MTHAAWCSNEERVRVTQGWASVRECHLKLCPQRKGDDPRKPSRIAVLARSQQRADNQRVHPVLGYLPQHIWEVGSVTLGAFIVAFGVWDLVTGLGVPSERRKPSTVRARGVAQIALGVALAISGFVINSEDAWDRQHHNHWGGPWDVAILIVWIAVLLGITCSVIRQRRRG